MHPFSPYFITEESERNQSYLDMLQNWLMPQLEEDSQYFIFQHDRTPHFYNDVRRYLNEHLPQRSIGSSGRDDKALLKWPPRSPGVMPCYFFYWGFIKDKVFVPPLTLSGGVARKGVRNEFAAIARDMLVRVWTEIEYHLNICAVSRRAPILNLCKVQLCCLPSASRHALLAKDLVTWQAMVGRHILEDIVGRVAQYVDEHYPVDK
ncbi:uncharacterized protein TNCV_4679911 [Trichonephila clavipes]|nr:uncharacterized protein TNCV_4679911 [Trichonephila clavipes]